MYEYQYSCTRVIPTVVLALMSPRFRGDINTGRVLCWELYGAGEFAQHCYFEAISVPCTVTAVSTSDTLTSASALNFERDAQ